MTDKIYPLDAEKILAELDEDGSVAQRLPFHEKRQAQLDLMKLIIRAFNEDVHVAAEAGTGVGKSFAYLVPALIFAEKTDERIVLSTATITLQQQLFEKDIPMVVSALGLNIKAVLIKGRGNYLCFRRLTSAFAEQSLLLDQTEYEILKSIDKWAQTSETGSRSDVPFMLSDHSWRQVASESDTCLGSRCPNRERCFITAVRKKANEAQILVVNHHLLFADIAAREEKDSFEGTVVLPVYQRIIIDEAHTIEQAATSFFSAEFSRFGINLALNRLFIQRGATISGSLLRLNAFLGGGDRSDFWTKTMDEIRDAAFKLDSAALDLCGTESVFRLIPQRDSIIRERIEPFFIQLYEKIVVFTSEIQRILVKVEENKTRDDNGDGTAASELDILLREVRAVWQRLTGFSRLCTAFISYKDYPDDVFWLERRGSAFGGNTAKSFAVFTKAPLNVSDKLKSALFDRYKTVACVSATMTVAGTFDYWASRCGITIPKNIDSANGNVLTGYFPSPFPYATEVLIAAATNVPIPGEAGFSDFIDTAVYRLIEAAGGSTLVLFTSFESLNSAYNYAAPRLSSMDICCLKQGSDDRNRLLKKFLADEQSALFATDSFWEGIDAPGDTLRLVILCRLPFRTPGDPIFQARCEARERQGGDPFMELSVPESVIKFRQGFGRLMRRSTDRGVVVILDSRIIKKHYGKFFLYSLPKTKTCFDTFNTVLKRVEGFLSE